nr:MAG TPA: Fibronectin type III domain [Bacteriophage sp.]DAY42096.1 MAG TPA: Fibronectin type III domain [Caudoviricetes sp.]
MFIINLTFYKNIFHKYHLPIEIYSIKCYSQLKF